MDIKTRFSLEEQQLGLLVNIIPSGAIVVDSLGNILHCNHELANTLGYQLEELADSNIEKLLPEEYRSRHQSLMQHFLTSPAKRQMGAGRELFALKKDGEKIPIEIGLNPIEVDGHTLVLATLVDISARLQANQMFKNSVSHAPYGVLVVSQEGTISFANTSLCSCFGYSIDELVGQSIEMLLPLRYRNGHQHLRQSYTEQPSVRMMGVGRDLTALHADGREFPIEIGLKPFVDENNNKMILVSLVDITTRKRMENKLKETNTNLEEFTYVASHDLRSPLRGISDLLEWIKEDLPAERSPDIDKNIDRISIRVDKMETMINNLLSYARAGNIQSDIRSINIKELIDNTLALLEIPKSFKLTLDISEGQIRSTLTPLETILRNVISNAIKHHDQEAGTINIACHRENSMLHFAVSDDGPGIPEAATERIFRLFQTVTSSERGNSGIGLSVCRRLAETHGGRICVENNSPEKGATFHIWWPRFIRKDTHD
ncbi:hypothetical protein tinsulaeT_22940 [Thalassotalea insulae]|uniref:histidine kinase n=1 Tax=Thalassotalea insulae TaxID=2056778 RepID=A0ABQ6GUU4_9GAMM|nr:PAS domain S-box protein [Thalassotalea insulae]GLX78954.1 hypothetical protein tinsulaeT_22940 [Thalassotalea insulae]